MLGDVDIERREALKRTTLTSATASARAREPALDIPFHDRRAEKKNFCVSNIDDQQGIKPLAGCAFSAGENEERLYH